MSAPSGAKALLLPSRARLALVTLACAVFAVHLLWSVRAIGVYTIDLGGIEGNVVYGIQKVLLGLPLYQDPERPTFDVIQYTPLYYYLAAALGLLFGVDAHEPQQVFILSRLLSLACNLGTVWATFRIARRCGVESTLATLCGLLLFATLTRHFLSRPDSLYLLLFALSMGSFLGALRAGASRTPGLMASAFFGCLAVLAKQSGALALGIPWLFLLWKHQYRDLFRFSAVAIAVLTLTFGALCWHYGADSIRGNLIDGLKNGLSADFYRHVFLERRYLLNVGFHAAGVFFVVRSLRGADLQRKALALAVVVTFLFALLTGAKSGSRLNYLLENFLLLYVAFALLIMDLAAAGRRTISHLMLGYAGLTLLAGPLRLQAWVSAIEGGDGRERYRQAVRMAHWLRDEQGLRPEQMVLVLGRDPVEHFLVGQGAMDQKDILFYSGPQLFDRTVFEQCMTDGTIRFVISRTPVSEVHFLGRTYPTFLPVPGPEGYAVREQAGASGRP